MDAPDVLTDEQMKRFGGEPVPAPGSLAPSKVPAPGPDNKLPVEETLTPEQMDYRAHLEGIHEKPLIHEDPAMTVGTAMAGGAVGRGVGFLARKTGAPLVAKLVEPAVAGAATSYLQHPGLKPTKGDAIAGGIGALLGLPGAAIGLVRQAPTAVAERLPSAVSGGLRSKAAKQAGGAVASDILDNHPELKKVLSVGDLPDKFNATGSTLNKLTSANDAVYDAIQAQHQGIPFDLIAAKIKVVAAQAHQAGDDTLEDAANAAINNLQRFADVADKRGGIVSATQLRGVRNTLARRVQAINPTLGASDVQAAADKIKQAISDGIEDIAGQTKGVDVAALRQRNKEIAGLLPVQRQLRAQVIDKNLLGPEDHLADFIEHPQRTIAGLVRKAPAHADAFLADRPTLQRFAAGARLPLGPKDATILMGGAASSIANPKRPVTSKDELEYAAKVAQGMKNGLSLADAMKEAEQ